MPTGRRSRRSYRAGPARRRTEWDNTISDNVSIAAGAQGVIEMTAGYREAANGATRKGLTIIRMIGNLLVRSTSASQRGEWVAGIAMVAEEAAVATIFPDPGTDVLFSWLWWDRGVDFHEAGGNVQNRYPIDVKSRRRFAQGTERLYFVFDNDSPLTGIELAVGIRVLYALP